MVSLSFDSGTLGIIYPLVDISLFLFVFLNLFPFEISCSDQQILSDFWSGYDFVTHVLGWFHSWWWTLYNMPTHLCCSYRIPVRNKIPRCPLIQARNINSNVKNLSCSTTSGPNIHHVHPPPLPILQSSLQLPHSLHPLPRLLFLR